MIHLKAGPGLLVVVLGVNPSETWVRRVQRMPTLGQHLAPGLRAELVYNMVY